MREDVTRGPRDLPGGGPAQRTDPVPAGNVPAPDTGIGARRPASAKDLLRPAIGLSLRLVRRYPWAKRVLLATASTVPPLKRKLVLFAAARPADEIMPGGWRTHPDPQVVAEWKRLVTRRFP